MRSSEPNYIPYSTREPADLTEVVRLYGTRHWIKQSYKQVKDQLGWADFRVRSTTRHPTSPNLREMRVFILLVRAVGDRRHLVRPAGLSTVLTVASRSLGTKLASYERCNPHAGGY
jgi:hypothetical protein